VAVQKRLQAQLRAAAVQGQQQAPLQQERQTFLAVAVAAVETQAQHR
jgi:hypothetical protein